MEESAIDRRVDSDLLFDTSGEDIYLTELGVVKADDSVRERLLKGVRIDALDEAVDVEVGSWRLRDPSKGVEGASGTLFFLALADIDDKVGEKVRIGDKRG